MIYRPRHLSVSAVQTYLTCPAAFHRRYVLGLYDPPTPAMAFGKVMALALEAEHRGQDGDVAWVQAYAREQQTLQADGRHIWPGIEHGLALLDLYRRRGVGQGTAEYRWQLYLPDRQAVPVPILGFMDLALPDAVWEFKTSLTTWQQHRVDGHTQGHVYGWAFRRIWNRRPRHVKFLVLSTHQLKLTEFDMQPSGDGIRLFERQAAAVWAGLVRDEYPPLCRRCAACQDAGVMSLPAAATEPVLRLEVS